MYYMTYFFYLVYLRACFDFFKNGKGVGCQCVPLLFPFYLLSFIDDLYLFIYVCARYLLGIALLIYFGHCPPFWLLPVVLITFWAQPFSYILGNFKLKKKNNNNSMIFKWVLFDYFHSMLLQDLILFISLPFSALWMEKVEKGDYDRCSKYAAPKCWSKHIFFITN